MLIKYGCYTSFIFTLNLELFPYRQSVDHSSTFCLVVGILSHQELSSVKRVVGNCKPFQTSVKPITYDPLLTMSVDHPSPVTATTCRKLRVIGGSCLLIGRVLQFSPFLQVSGTSSKFTLVPLQDLWFKVVVRRVASVNKGEMSPTAQ